MFRYNIQNCIILFLLGFAFSILILFLINSSTLGRIKQACDMVGLFGSFASIFGIGTISLLGYLYGSVMTKMLFQRKLWRLTSEDVNNLYILIASRKDQIATRIIEKIPASGIGQVKALGYVFTSISKGYQTSINPERILLSEFCIQDPESKHLLLLGGPLTNQYTRKILGTLSDLKIMTNDSFYSICHDQHEWKIDTNDKSVDYGVIIYSRNIFDSGNHHSTRLYALFGLHTYGTLGASKYFVSDFYGKVLKYWHFKKALYWVKSLSVSIANKLLLILHLPIIRLNSRKESGDGIIAVVKCEIVNESPTKMTLEDYWTFDSKNLP